MMVNKVATRSSKTNVLDKQNLARPAARGNAQRPATRRVQQPPSALQNFVGENIQWLFLTAAAIVIGVVLFIAYQTATASSFFSVKNVDVAGSNRTSRETIEKLVRGITARTGVWNADLTIVHNEIENLPAVKSAVVSRVMPDAFRVRIVEREPKALVRLEQTNKIVWVDDEAKILGAPSAAELAPPFFIQAWSESRDEDGRKLNQERVRLYLKLLEEWSRAALADRVTAVDLSNLADVRALINRSGTMIWVELGNQDFGERLRSTWQLLEQYDQNGNLERIDKVIANQQYPIVSLRETNAASAKKMRLPSRIIR